MRITWLRAFVCIMGLCLDVGCLWPFGWWTFPLAWVVHSQQQEIEDSICERVSERVSVHCEDDPQVSAPPCIWMCGCVHACACPLQELGEVVTEEGMKKCDMHGRVMP